MRPLDLATRGILSSQLPLGLASRGSLRFTIGVSDFDPFFIIPTPSVRKFINLSDFTTPNVHSTPTVQTISPVGVQVLDVNVNIRAPQPANLSTVTTQDVYNKKDAHLSIKKPVDVINTLDPEVYNKEKG